MFDRWSQSRRAARSAWTATGKLLQGIAMGIVGAVGIIVVAAVGTIAVIAAGVLMVLRDAANGFEDRS